MSGRCALMLVVAFVLAMAKAEVRTVGDVVGLCRALADSNGNADDAVVLQPGEYDVGVCVEQAHGAFTSRLYVAGCTLQGESDDPRRTVLFDSTRSGRILVVGEGARIANLTVSNGYAVAGMAAGILSEAGAVSARGALCSNVVVTCCTGKGDGAGITGVDCIDCESCFNMARHGAGASHIRSFVRGSLHDNVAERSGGGGLNVNADGTRVFRNRAGYAAGLSANAEVDCLVRRCEIVSNVSCSTDLHGAVGGGGLGCITLWNLLRVEDCTIIGNVASNYGGGAAFCELRNCRVSGNCAPWGGGAYMCDSFGCELTDNAAMQGGGIYGGWCEGGRVEGNRPNDSTHGEGAKAEDFARCSFDHRRLLVGTAPVRYLDDGHLADLHACGIDFISAGDPDPFALDRCAYHGVCVLIRGVVPFCGGNGIPPSAAPLFTKAAYDRSFERIRRKASHPAVMGYTFADEPSAREMDYIGKMAGYARKRLPGLVPFYNLHPSYAARGGENHARTLNLLGVPGYRDYVEAYCQKTPLDYISFDNYVMTPEKQYRPMLLSFFYENFETVADACRATGRGLVFYAQANSHQIPPYDFNSANRLRFQANTALAYGMEAIIWACWERGWWTNNVLTAEGRKTEQYDKLVEVNAELHRIGPDYMRFCNRSTHYVGFETNVLKRIRGRSVESLDTGYFRDVALTSGTPLLVGEMSPRQGGASGGALLVVPSGDPFDLSPAVRRVKFNTGDCVGVRVCGGEGEIPLERDADGSYSFPLAESHAALIIGRW